MHAIQCVNPANASVPVELRRCARLFSPTDLRTAQRASKERPEDADVQQTSKQRHRADDRDNDAGGSSKSQQAPDNQRYTSYNANDPAGTGSHECTERVHRGTSCVVEFLILSSPACFPDKLAQLLYNDRNHLPAVDFATNFGEAQKMD